MSKEDVLMMQLLKELLNNNESATLSTAPIQDSPEITDALISSILQNTPLTQTPNNFTQATPNSVKVNDGNIPSQELEAIKKQIQELKQTQHKNSSEESSLKVLKKQVAGLEQNQEAFRRNLKDQHSKEDLFSEIKSQIETQNKQYASLNEAQNHIREDFASQTVSYNKQHQLLTDNQNKAREEFGKYKQSQAEKLQQIETKLNDYQKVLESITKQSAEKEQSIKANYQKLQEQQAQLKQQIAEHLTKDALEHLKQSFSVIQQQQQEDRQNMQSKLPQLQSQTAKLEGNLEALKNVFEFLQNQTQNGQGITSELFNSQIEDLEKRINQRYIDFEEKMKSKDEFALKADFNTLDEKQNQLVQQINQQLEVQNQALEARVQQLESQLEMMLSISKTEASKEEVKPQETPQSLEWQWLKDNIFRQETQLRKYLPKSFVLPAQSGETFFWVGEKMGLLYLVIFRAKQGNSPTLSLMGNFLVNNLIIESKLMDAAAITDELNYRFQEILKQKNDDKEKPKIQFGICIADRVNDTLYFSGAGTDLLVNNKTLKRIKGEKYLIGKKGAKFRKDTIPIRKGYQFFILSKEEDENQYTTTEELMSTVGKEAVLQSKTPEIQYEKGETPYILGFSL